MTVTYLPALLPHQRDFVSRVLDPDGSRILALEAPTGTGKLSTLAVAASAVAAEHGGRVLFLSPMNATVMQFVSRVSHGPDGVEAQVVDRSVARLLAGRAWPLRTVYGMTQAAGLVGSVMDDVISQDWALVILEEPPLPDGRVASVIRPLIDNAERVVLAGGARRPWKGASDVELVQWRMEELTDAEGRSLAPPMPREESVEYKVPARWRELQPNDAAVPNFDDLLSSSPAALERALLTAFQRSKSDEDAVARLSSLESLSEERDEKLEALFRIAQNAANEGVFSICVTTRYRATAFYLSAALELGGIRSSLLTGDMPSGDVDVTVRVFRESGGVLVATEASLRRARSLPNVQMLVLYDDVSDGDRRRELVATFNPLGRPDALRVLRLRRMEG